MGAGTGLLFYDFIIRPFLKIGMKFPLVGMIFLFVVYGFIAYITLRSAYMVNQEQ